MQCLARCLLGLGLVLLLPATGMAQTMSFSVYSDAAISEDVSTAYGYNSVSDNSSGCTHSNYTDTIYIYTPNGNNNSAEFGGMSGSIGIPIDGEGDYTIVTSGTYRCSCIFGGTAGYGGSGVPFHFRTVNTYYKGCYSTGAGTCYCPLLNCLPGTAPHCGIGTVTFRFTLSCTAAMGSAYWIVEDDDYNYLCTLGWSWNSDGYQHACT
jgi:hypothetical protein